MTLFYYKAVTPAGETLDGQMDVGTHEEVIGKLQDAGNIPLEVREADSGDSASLLIDIVESLPLDDSVLKVDPDGAYLEKPRDVG